MDNKLHPLLLRQLSRHNLDYNVLPTHLKEWQLFLKNISNNYTAIDQDNYLITRSLEISSREFFTLNQQSENAQHITGMGYWNFNVSTGKFYSSKELNSLLGYSPEEPAPQLDDILKAIHPDDRDLLLESMNKAANQGINYDISIRILNKRTSEYRWLQYIGAKETPTANSGDIILSGTAMDITNRKQSELEVAQLNNKLMISARMVGMAEVATSVLHNIGNVLNSINISITLLKENTSEPLVNKLKAVIKLLEDHLPTLSEFLTQDEKGKLIPKYLSALTDEFLHENQKVKNEIQQIFDNVTHLKDIIASQQTISGIKTKIEDELISLPELMETAIQINSYEFTYKNIRLIKNYDAIPAIYTNKSKLLQIFINLIRNAVDSVLEANPETKIVTIDIKEIPNNKISIAISDNGVGIKNENLIKIFSFGFTTKKNGHGFGLHSCAIAIKELQGSIRAESQGLGKGAAFILTLPIKRVNELSNL